MAVSLWSCHQVVHALHKVASLGRSVVCTIHQPSAELFFNFDDLLLLKSGGHTVYFGPVGFRGATVRSYFESLPGTVTMSCSFIPYKHIHGLQLTAVHGVQLFTALL